MNKKYAVILSGCGAQDGAEIYEATYALLAIARNGNSYKIFAPNIEQKHVINHLDGSELAQSRNVMQEAARIARGAVSPLSELRAEDFDTLVIPGGFGAAKNLFDFAFNYTNCTIIEDYQRVVEEFWAAKKPIGAMCIAPVSIAKILGSKGVEVTLGPSGELTEDIQKAYGATVSQTLRDGVIIDQKNLIVTTPAFMYGDSSIVDIAAGAQQMVDELDKM